jgi:hypothetical protein
MMLNNKSLIVRNAKRFLSSSSLTHVLSTPTTTQIRHYAPKQRRIDLTLQNPFDKLEEYKKRMNNIERIDENTPYYKPIFTDDVLLQRNIEINEKLKESGKIPGRYNIWQY